MALTRLTSLQVTFKHGGVGAVIRSLFSKLSDTVSVNDFSSIQDGINALSATGGGVLEFPAGTFLISAPITLKSNVKLVGKGYGVTVIKLTNGANCDLVVTEGFGTFASLQDVGVPKDFGIEKLTIDGNYLASDWNSATNTINNTTGYGLKVEGFGFTVDVELYNIPEVGIRIKGESSAPATQDIYSHVSVFGRVFGKEGLIMTGPNDIIIDKAWLGLCGILPRPTADTTFATSTEYVGETVDGIVIDDANVELGDIHVYACWSGRGLRTRNTVRLEGSHLISESNNGQIDFSANTYGSIGTVSVRNLSMLHPNWSAAKPTYTGPDSRWDAFTCAASAYNVGSLKINRTITGTSRIAGTNGLVLSGAGCQINLTYNNSSPTDASDPEFGGRYTGQPVLLSGQGNTVVASVCNPRGAVLVSGNQNVVNAALISPVGFGVRCSGNQNLIGATCQSQTQDGGSGSAFSNEGSNNIWNTSGLSNAVPFASSVGLGRVGGTNVYGSTRSFTITTDAITVTTFDSQISVDTEAAAATDDLSTINGGATNQRLTLVAANSARDVVVKDGVGNIRSAGDFTLTHNQDRMVLEWDGSSWVEISRSDNSV